MRATVRAYGIAAAVVLIDQLSKAWAIDHLPRLQTAPLLPALLQMRLVFNNGAAFSLWSGGGAALGLVSLFVSVALVIWIESSGPLRRWQWLGGGLLLGGAVGNGLDRWRLGTVVDFLELVPVSFPIFNAADVAINVAVACFLIDVWQQRRHGQG
jgi:signal peptidase II